MSDPKEEHKDDNNSEELSTAANSQLLEFNVWLNSFLFALPFTKKKKKFTFTTHYFCFTEVINKTPNISDDNVNKGGKFEILMLFK